VSGRKMSTERLRADMRAYLVSRASRPREGLL
jgi:hypothetical protein